MIPSRGAGKARQALELLFLACVLAVPLAAVPWTRCAHLTRVRKCSFAAWAAQLGLVVLRFLAPQPALVRAGSAGAASSEGALLATLSHGRASS